MSEEISSDGVYKTRSALGDITNRTGKRNIPFISSSDVKSRDGYIDSALGDITNRAGKRGISFISSSDVKSRDGSDVEKKIEGSQFAKRACVRMENLIKGSMACVSPHPCSEINSLRDNVISGISKIPSGIKETCSSDGVAQIGGAGITTDNSVKLGDAKRDSCVSTIATPTVLCNKDYLDIRGEIHKDKGLSSDVADGNDLQEKLETSACVNDDNDLGHDSLNSSKDEYVEYSRLPESQESGISGLERCIGLKGDGCSNSSEGVDLINACSCSFCTKAAYIWSDLHYQDMKGRIAALKKSQKEASILVQRSCRDNWPEKRGQGNFNKFSRLESDLTGHWTSLFLRTEDILVRECSQLEASLFNLKDLRDNYKTELELMTGKPAETEQSASHSSHL